MASRSLCSRALGGGGVGGDSERISGFCLHRPTGYQGHRVEAAVWCSSLCSCYTGLDVREHRVSSVQTTEATTSSVRSSASVLFVGPDFFFFFFFLSIATMTLRNHSVNNPNFSLRRWGAKEEDHHFFLHFATAENPSSEQKGTGVVRWEFVVKLNNPLTSEQVLTFFFNIIWPAYGSRRLRPSSSCSMWGNHTSLFRCNMNSLALQQLTMETCHMIVSLGLKAALLLAWVAISWDSDKAKH